MTSSIKSIQARWDGACGCCQSPFKQGDWISYDYVARKAYCVTYPACSDAAVAPVATVPDAPVHDMSIPDGIYAVTVHSTPVVFRIRTHQSGFYLNNRTVAIKQYIAKWKSHCFCEVAYLNRHRISFFRKYSSYYNTTVQFAIEALIESPEPLQFRIADDVQKQHRGKMRTVHSL